MSSSTNVLTAHVRLRDAPDFIGLKPIENAPTPNRIIRSHL